MKRIFLFVFLFVSIPGTAKQADFINYNSTTHRSETNLLMANIPQSGVKVIHVPFIDNYSNSADCFDVCYSKGSYCLEFYDKDTGLEFPCGKGERRSFTDRLGANQYAQHGDVCICRK